LSDLEHIRVGVSLLLRGPGDSLSSQREKK
jgi:hypothetical protein